MAKFMMSARQVVGYKYPISPSTVPHPLTMSTAHTTTANTASKDPLKMLKGELLRLYKTTIAENEDLAKKYG